MIPYVDIPPLDLVGPLKIQPFGFLVFMALLTGYHSALWHGRKVGLDLDKLASLVVWVIVGAFIGAHEVSLFVYFPERFIANPLEVFYFWSNLSSYGGFLGGTIAAVIFLKKNKLPMLPYCDAIGLAAITGWFFGRMGCSVAHDHPGVATNLFFGVNYPSGPHHDLGFEEWVLTIIIIAIIYFLRRRNPRPGVLLTTIVILYAPVRFVMDYARTIDVLYFGLTPGQYFSVALFITGLVLLWVLLKDKKEEKLAKAAQK